MIASRLLGALLVAVLLWPVALLAGGPVCTGRCGDASCCRRPAAGGHCHLQPKPAMPCHGAGRASPARSPTSTCRLRSGCRHDQPGQARALPPALVPTPPICTVALRPAGATRTTSPSPLDLALGLDAPPPRQGPFSPAQSA